MFWQELEAADKAFTSEERRTPKYVQKVDEFKVCAFLNLYSKNWPDVIYLDI